VHLAHYEEGRQEGQHDIEWRLSANQAAVVVVPSHSREYLNQHIVVQAALDVLEILVCATQDSDNEVQHQDKVY
jgi:hypothetical protein